MFAISLGDVSWLSHSHQRNLRRNFAWMHGENDCIIILPLQLSGHVLDSVNSS
jgi:hypothetical protein